LLTTSGAAPILTLNYKEAFRLHQKLIDIGQRSPEVFYNCGLICQKRGEVRDAIVFYREALKEDPDFPEALLNLGHALKYIGAQEEAISCWRKAISLKPELAEDYFEAEES